MAVAAAARATEGWGAIDALPDADRRGVKATAKRPARSRVRAIRDRLRRYYGRPRNEPHHAPLDELVLTVLSQNTNDRNRDVAYVRLRNRFPDWEAVAAAPVEEIEEAIRPGGISKVKSLRIKSMLEVIEAETGGLDLGFLAEAPREEAIEFLERLPGVGRKTAACVLLFAFDRPGDAGRHARLPGLLAARAAAPEGLVRGGPRRDARGHRPGRRLRAAREPDPPRPADLHRPQARLPASARCWACALTASASPAAPDERRAARAGAAPGGGERDRGCRGTACCCVRVTAPPADGKANDAVRKLIARRAADRRHAGRDRARGAASRDKVLRLHGVAQDLSVSRVSGKHLQYSDLDFLLVI